MCRLCICYIVDGIFDFTQYICCCCCRSRSHYLSSRSDLVFFVCLCCCCTLSISHLNTYVCQSVSFTFVTLLQHWAGASDTKAPSQSSLTLETDHFLVGFTTMHVTIKYHLCVCLCAVISLRTCLKWEFVEIVSILFKHFLIRKLLAASFLIVLCMCGYMCVWVWVCVE